MLIVALAGTVATLYSTLGRTADHRDVKVAEAMRENRTLALRNEDLETARATAKFECRSGAGAKCATATARVDALVASMATLRTVSTDPRGDAIADLLHLVASVDRAHTRKVVAAVDPIVLILEVGSILFFAAAFPRRKVAIVSKVETIAEPCTAIEPQSFTREQALQDLLTMREAGSGRVLAQRWHVDPSTASRWLQSFQAEGAIDRNRAGKSKAVLAIAGPTPTRKKIATFRHQHRNQA